MRFLRPAISFALESARFWHFEIGTPLVVRIHRLPSSCLHRLLALPWTEVSEIGDSGY
jgi:hypothetical protein